MKNKDICAEQDLDNSKITAKKKPRSKVFEKGKSGNPKGRPVGSISNLVKTMREDAAEIWPLIKKETLSGDRECLKIVAQYGLPKIRGFVEDPYSVSARMQEILTAYKTGEKSLKDTALDLDINGIPLPGSIKILPGKEQPEPVDPSAGVYRSIPDEEMEEMVARRRKELAEQVKAIPERRREIEELMAKVDNNWNQGKGSIQ